MGGIVRLGAKTQCQKHSTENETKVFDYLTVALPLITN